MNDFLVASAIKKDYRNKSKSFNTSSNKCYASIKYHQFESYMEVEFYIKKIFQLIMNYKKIFNILQKHKESTIVTECLNREFVLRLLLLIMGFKKEVKIENTFCINKKYYHHLIYCYYS
ncbi:hypothetical protein J0M70_00225 [Listeria monocytogenes]|nr:hypothetical protein [Listeria monocytogenes]